MRRLQYIISLSLTVLVFAGCGPKKPASLLDEILAKERQGLDALKDGNVPAFANSTAEDAVFIDPHGIASKAEVVKNVAGFRLEDYSIEDAKLVPLSETSGLIVYTITEKGNSHGREFSAKAYISSLWMKRKNEWVCLFSQETPTK